MKEVVIVGAARTPVGRFGGGLKDISAVQLGVIAVQGGLAAGLGRSGKGRRGYFR